MEQFMRETDAFSWYLEADPVLRSTVVVAQMFDRAPDWAAFTARMEQATLLVPELRARLVEAPARLAPPRWEHDPEFDLGWHLRRVGTPVAPAQDVILDMACRDASTGFDRTRPLWRFTLIEGLDEGRAALVMKMHHSITDGLGAIQLASALYDRERQPRRPVSIRGGSGRNGAPAVGLLSRYGGHRLRRVLSAGTGVGRQAVPAVLRSAVDPLGSITSTVALTASIGRTVQPLFDTKSPIMKKRGRGRRLAFLECELDALRAAGQAAGGTVNDAFIAAASAGLRIYHQHHGADLNSLRMMMPISLRTPDDPAGGNRITLMRFEIPAGEEDTARRIQMIDRASRRARHERSLPYTNPIAGVLNLLPSQALAGIFKHVDFLASDVPTFPYPVYLAGAEMQKQVAFGPTTGTALNLTLASYVGHCTIGVTMDSLAVPDSSLMTECLRAGLEEVLAFGAAPPTGPAAQAAPEGVGVGTAH